MGIGLLPVNDLTKRAEEAHCDIKALKDLMQQQLAMLERIANALENR